MLICIGKKMHLLTFLLHGLLNLHISPARASDGFALPSSCPHLRPRQAVLSLAWLWHLYWRLCYSAKEWFMALENKEQEGYSTEMSRVSISLWGQRISVTLWRWGAGFKPMVSLTVSALQFFFFLSVQKWQNLPTLSFILARGSESYRVNNFLFSHIHVVRSDYFGGKQQDPVGRKTLGVFPFSLVQTTALLPHQHQGLSQFV